MDWQGNRSNRVFHRKKVVRYQDMLKVCAIPACITSIVKKEAVDDIRFRDEPMEDYVFWLEVFRKGYVAYNTNTVQGLYRLTPNSRSSHKLLQFIRHWHILRDVEKVNFFRACYYQVYYAIVSFIKYLK